MTAKRQVFLRDLSRVRSQSEDNLISVVRPRLFEAKARVLRVARTVKKDDGWDDNWDDWLEDFHRALNDMEWKSSVKLGEVHEDFWSAMGRTVFLDPQKLALLHSDRVGSRIDDLPSQILGELRQDVIEWVGTDQDLDSLISNISGVVGLSRARLIALQETSLLFSSYMTEAMTQAGVINWFWETANDDLVCKTICEPLHGQKFTLSDPKPPDASHIGCRCTMAPDV